MNTLIPSRFTTNLESGHLENDRYYALRVTSLVCVLSVLWGAAEVSAQGLQGSLSFEQTCLTDIMTPVAQSSSIDERDQLHLSRINGATRELTYTRISLGGDTISEAVVTPIDLEVSPVNDTDILARRDQVYICSHRSTQGLRSLVVFIRDQSGVWREELLALNAADGAQCEIMWFDGKLRVAASQEGQVYWYTREPTEWTEEVLTPEGQSQGFDLRATVTSQGRVLLAHRSADYAHLYLSVLNEGVWEGGETPFNTPFNYAAAGVRPQAIEWPDGLVWIFHGSRNGNTQLDFDGDGYSLVTEVPLDADPFTFQWSNYDGLGGINAARVFRGEDGDPEVYFLTRELLRNPVTGNRFALRMHRVTFDYSLDEYYQLDQSIAGFPHYHLRPNIHETPTALPAMTHIDDSSMGTKSCFWRLTDRDGDGLPDEGERRRGTNADLADSDGDGRSDGLEVREGTNPLIVDDGNPLMWPPEVTPLDDTEPGGEMAGDMAGDMAGETQAGEAPAGEIPAGETPAGETPAGETPAGEIPSGETPAGETPAGETPAGEVPAGETPAGETPAGETPAGETPAGEVPAGEVASGENMIGGTPEAGLFAGFAAAGDEDSDDEDSSMSTQAQGGCQQDPRSGLAGYGSLMLLLSALTLLRRRTSSSSLASCNDQPDLT